MRIILDRIRVFMVISPKKPKKLKIKTDTMRNIMMKFVPHLGWIVEYFITLSASRFSPLSKACIVLCSAPWY